MSKKKKILALLLAVFIIAVNFIVIVVPSKKEGETVTAEITLKSEEQNEFQVFYKIIIPLAMPQLAVIFLFSFIATYSEYVITSIFLQTPGKMTLALGLQSFISDQFAAHWTLFAAAAVISSLPIMIIFMCLQRFIQNGLVAGGVKG